MICRPFTISRGGHTLEGNICLTEGQWELMTDQRLSSLHEQAFAKAYPDAADQVKVPEKPVKHKKGK